MIFTFFDVETTGLPKSRTLPVEQQPKICELGIILFDTDNMSVEAQYSQLINPGIKMPDGIMPDGSYDKRFDVIKIHGITDEMVAMQPPFAEVWKEAWRFFGGRSDYMVAHNLPFDKQLLDWELERMGWNGFVLPEGVCTVQEFTHLFGKRPKLTELYERATGKVYEHKHRAIDDTRILLESVTALGFFDAFKGLLGKAAKADLEHDEATGWRPQPIGENHYEAAEREAAAKQDLNVTVFKE